MDAIRITGCPGSDETVDQLERQLRFDGWICGLIAAVSCELRRREYDSDHQAGYHRNQEKEAHEHPCPPTALDLSDCSADGRFLGHPYKRLRQFGQS